MRIPKTEIKMTSVHVEVEEYLLREFRRKHPEYGALSKLVRGALKAWVEKHRDEVH